MRGFLNLNFFSTFFISPYKIYLVLIVAPMLVYSRSLFFDFSPMDENWLISGNTLFLKDWSALLLSFKSTIQKIYYRPLLLNSFVIDYHLAELNPLMYHLSNLVFHVLATLLFYRFLLLLKVETRAAFFATLLFSVHPLTAHAVTWVPGRNDVLFCIFSLLSFNFLLRYLSSKKLANFLFHVLFFLTALFTKETAIALPAVYLGLFLIRSGARKDLVMMSVGWILAGSLWFVAREKNLDYFPLEKSLSVTVVRDFLLSLVVFGGKSIFPFFQSVSPVMHNSFLWLNLALLIVFGFIVYKRGFADRKMALLGLFIFLALISLPAWYGAQTTLGEQYEHRAYAPLIGFMLLMSQLKLDFTDHLVKTTCIFLVFLFSLKTCFRQNIYKSEVSFLEEGIHDCPENYFFHSQRAILCYFDRQYEASLPYFDQAIALNSSQAKLFNNRGNAHFQLNHKEAAIADYTRALELSHKKPSIYLARCEAYRKFGEIDKAREDMEAIKKLYPGVISPTLEEEILIEWLDDKLIKLNTLIEKEPNNGGLYVRRAKLFFNKRMGREALADLKKACELAPRNHEYKAYYDKLNATFPH